MATLFIRHRVKDYEAWKRVYDAYDRKGDGCTRATVHRDPDDPNLVVVTETFPDIATDGVPLTVEGGGSGESPC